MKPQSNTLSFLIRYREGDVFLRRIITVEVFVAWIESKNNLLNGGSVDNKHKIQFPIEWQHGVVFWDCQEVLLVTFVSQGKVYCDTLRKLRPAIENSDMVCDSIAMIHDAQSAKKKHLTLVNKYNT